jgi:uncharacterized protein with FMN-binding domain
VLLAGIAGLYILLRLRAYEQKIDDAIFSGIGPGDVRDGVYRGEYDADFIAARAEVTIREGKLEKVRLLEYRHGRGEAALPILEEMARRQRLDVDAVTGATNSCIVIRKAVELALESAPPRNP